MKKVLISFSNREFDPCEEGIAHRMLREHGFEITQYEDDEHVFIPQQEIDKLGQDYDAIISMGVTVDEEFLKRVTPRMKIIARYGSGYDEIDAKLAREYGVTVTITREDVHSNGVAETAHALIFAMLYHIPQFYCEYVVNRHWHQRVHNIQLRGKTVGFFGFGMIAQCLAQQLQGTGIRMIATDIYPNQEAADRLGVTFVPFDELLETSDIISIHAPGTEENHHVFNSAAFSKMKKGACLVNAARGILVDEAALYAALISGRLRAAAADTLHPEPAAADNPLFTLDNFIATPHIAGHTVEGRKKLCVSSAQAIIDYFDGKEPFFMVN